MDAWVGGFEFGLQGWSSDEKKIVFMGFASGNKLKLKVVPMQWQANNVYGKKDILIYENRSLD